MTNKTLSNGITQTSFADDGDQLIIAQSQDITGVIESNKREYAQSMNNRGWDGENVFGAKNKVATVPLVVFAELEKQGITRGFQVLDEDRFKAWLNNPDNQVFRTRQGRI